MHELQEVVDNFLEAPLVSPEKAEEIIHGPRM